MLSHQSRPIDRDFAQPAILKATILKIITSNPQKPLTLECVDERGNNYTDVQFIVNTSGSSSGFIQPALSVGNEIMIIRTTANAPVYALGTVYRSGATAPRQQYVQPTQYTNNISITAGDFVIDNGGNRIVLGVNQRGTTINGNKDIKLQMPRDGVLRISSDGLSKDNPLNGAEFITVSYNYLEEIRNKHLQLHETVNALVDQVSLLQDALSTFMGTSSAATVEPALAAGAATYNTTFKPTLDNLKQNVSTEQQNYDGLSLRDHPTAVSQAAHTLNSKVKLPQD